MPKCASCEKEVYLTEELRCLDQIWHKYCFRCEVCKKTLNVNNCKGYGGKPYCSVHYPQCKTFTFVSDTPEFKQVSENTKNMSKIAYHKSYEENRGRKISIPDDMSMRGQQEISKVISQTGYAQKTAPLTNTGSRNSEIAENRAGGSWYSESVAYPQTTRAVSAKFDSKENFSHGNNVNGSGNVSRPLGDTQKQDSQIYNGKIPEGNAQSFPSGQTQVAAPNLVLLGGLRVTGSGKHFQAMYDYDAGDTDEVSFREGDLILHGEPIDDGWMYGTVKRTGQFGMLPSNYVAPIPNQ